LLDTLDVAIARIYEMQLSAGWTHDALKFVSDSVRLFRAYGSNLSVCGRTFVEKRGHAFAPNSGGLSLNTIAPPEITVTK